MKSNDKSLKSEDLGHGGQGFQRPAQSPEGLHVGLGVGENTNQIGSIDSVHVGLRCSKIQTH